MTMNNPKRILVVDDEPSVTRNLKLNLEARGEYCVRTESDPTHVLTVARTFRPDLILLDVIMPELEGGEVAARLADDPLLRDVPIVFLTAIVSNAETGGHEMIRGEQTFVAKPVDLGELERTIEDHLRARTVPAPLPMSLGGGPGQQDHYCARTSA